MYKLENESFLLVFVLLFNYFSWVIDQNNITKPSYDILLTGVGGVIYPPDIFNINEKYLKLIEETITGDDIILKYLEVLKGIEQKWIPKTFSRIKSYGKLNT